MGLPARAPRLSGGSIHDVTHCLFCGRSAAEDIDVPKVQKIISPGGIYFAKKHSPTVGRSGKRGGRGERRLAHAKDPSRPIWLMRSQTARSLYAAKERYQTAEIRPPDAAKASMESRHSLEVTKRLKTS
jgi:hypothetical protein